MGGYFGGESSQETPDMQTAMFEYADGAILEFGTRGEPTNDEGGQRIGNIFYGTKGWLWTEESGRDVAVVHGTDGRQEREGTGLRRPRPRKRQGLTTIEFAHYQNFIDAIRANDPKMLACDIMEGHLSSTLPHLANISYRVGHGLTFNGKTETFENDKAADKLLTREYPKGIRDSVALVAGLAGGGARLLPFHLAQLRFTAKTFTGGREVGRDESIRAPPRPPVLPSSCDAFDGEGRPNCAPLRTRSAPRPASPAATSSR